MEYVPKYINKSSRTTNCPQGRPVRSDKWITGPDILRRDKYYSFLKHRSQCKFRNEDFNMTFEDWETIWPDDMFLQRGRSKESLTMTRIDWELPWEVSNIQILSRSDFVRLQQRKVHET